MTTTEMIRYYDITFHGDKIHINDHIEEAKSMMDKIIDAKPAIIAHLTEARYYLGIVRTTETVVSLGADPFGFPEIMTEVSRELVAGTSSFSRTDSDFHTAAYMAAYGSALALVDSHSADAKESKMDAVGDTRVRYDIKELEAVVASGETHPDDVTL